MNEDPGVHGLGHLLDLTRLEGEVPWDGQRRGETARQLEDDNRKLKRVVPELMLG